MTLREELLTQRPDLRNHMDLYDGLCAAAGVVISPAEDTWGGAHWTDWRDAFRQDWTMNSFRPLAWWDTYGETLRFSLMRRYPQDVRFRWLSLSQGNCFVKQSVRIWVEAKMAQAPASS